MTSAHSKTGLTLAETYQVLHRLGAGSMGEVYAARHLRLGKRIAIKFLRGELSGEARCVERFKREVRSLAAVSDAHVVEIFDCGETDDAVPYFVMEYLVGQDVERALRCAPLDTARVLRLAEHACRGLAAVHAAGLVHRDIKPGNLFLIAEPRYSERCKILDFGVAKLGSTSSTRGGAILGTVRYMAPEQLMDSASVGAACDLYGLGAVMYHCLAGVRPHRAESEPELMFEILNRAPRPLAELRPDLPGGLAELVDQALAKDPALRPASAEAFGERLRELATRAPRRVAAAASTASSETGSVSPASARAQARARGALRSLLRVPLALAALSGMALLAGTTLRTRPAPSEARPERSRPVPAPFPAVAPINVRTASPEPTTPIDGSTLLVKKTAPNASSSSTPAHPVSAAHPAPKPPSNVAVSAPGQLRIGAEPHWAAIRLDGTPVGSTPLLLPGVAAGRHVLQARALGTGSVEERTVELASGETLRVLFHANP